MYVCTLKYYRLVEIKSDVQKLKFLSQLKNKYCSKTSYWPVVDSKKDNMRNSYVRVCRESIPNATCDTMPLRKRKAVFSDNTPLQVEKFFDNNGPKEATWWEQLWETQGKE